MEPAALGWGRGWGGLVVPRCPAGQVPGARAPCLAAAPHLLRVGTPTPGGPYVLPGQGVSSALPMDPRARGPVTTLCLMTPKTK